MKFIADLHIITQNTGEGSHLHQIEKLKHSNADWIQLRVKDKEQSEWFEIGRKAKDVLADTDIKLIINDNVYLAKEIDAYGVHVGNEDMDVAEAREILGPDKVIGGTANTYDDIIRLSEAGVDYIGLGPYKETKTKQNLSPIIQYFGYEVILKKLELNKIKIPIIAIGGIEVEDVVKLMLTGVSGVAVSSAIVKSNSPNQRVEDFQIELNKFQFTEK